MEKYKVGTGISVQYLALKRTTGLTDLVLKSYNALNVLVDTLPMVEDANGIYQVVFTPATVGFWRIEISSVSNGDYSAKEYDIVAIDIADVKAVADATKTELDATKTELDATKTEVDAINTNVVAVEGAIVSMQTDITDIKTKVTDIQTTVNTIKADINSLELPSGGYIL
jgi:hypothetical protein